MNGAYQMVFDSLRDNIKNCRECIPANCHCPPLHFECKSPDKVKILVISEQPMETDNVITEDTIKEYLQGKRRGSPTISDIANLFSEKYINSILRDEGTFYWTHHTKCPSSKGKSTQNKCPKKWLYKEITAFSNLKYIITIGSSAHEAIMQLAGCDPDLINTLWKEFESVILNKYDVKKINANIINIHGKEFDYISLPHTTGQNPLSYFIPYLNPLIKKAEEAVW